MCHKRFSKFLPAVLALALWAGTAYGQGILTDTNAPLTFTYTQFANAPGSQQVIFSVTDTNDTTVHSFGVPQGNLPSWLTVDNCGGTTSISGSPAVSATCTFTINTTNKVWVDGHPGSHTNIPVVPVIDGANDTFDEFLVNLTFTAHSPLSASNAEIDLSFTQGTTTVVSTLLTITSTEDASASDTYTTNATSCGWLTLTSTSTGIPSGTVLEGSTDTLKFQVNATQANLLNPANSPFTTCSVQINDGNSNLFDTVPVHLTLTAPTLTPPGGYTSISPHNLTFILGTAGQAGSSVTVNVGGTSGVPYTATTLPPGITGGTSCTTGTANCTFTVDPTFFAGTTAGTTGNLLVVVSVTGVTPAVTANLYFTVTTTSAVLTTSAGITSGAGAIALAFYPGGGGSQAGLTSALFKIDTSTNGAVVVPLLGTPVQQSGPANWLSRVAGGCTLANTNCQVQAAYSASTAPGTYTGYIPVTVTNGDPASILKIYVSLVVTDPTFTPPNGYTFGSPHNLTYILGTPAPGQAGSTVTVTVTGSAGIAYTATTLPPGITNSGNCTINTNDCTFAVDPAHFAGTAAGTTGTLDVQLTVTGVTPAVTTDLYFTVTTTSAVLTTSAGITSGAGAIALSFYPGGGGSQAGLTSAAFTIGTSTAGAVVVPLLGTPVQQSGPAGWLSRVAGGCLLTTADCQVQAAYSAATAPGTYTGYIPVTVTNGDPASILKIYVSLTVGAQPLVSGTAAPVTVTLTIAKGATTPVTANPTVKEAAFMTAPSVVVQADSATQPPWLTFSAPNPIGPSATALTFTTNTAVTQNMAPGTYQASGFAIYATGAPDFTIPVTLTITNAASDILSIKEAASAINGTITNTFLTGSTAPALPTPTVTPYSADEPIPFTATCVASTSPAITPAGNCYLNSSTASTATGIAQSWGAPLTVSFDQAYFTGRLYGTTVTATVTVTITGTATQTALAYTYEILPPAPTITSFSPTSSTAITNGVLLVNLTGTDFYPPSKFTNGVASTQAFVQKSSTVNDNLSGVSNATVTVVSGSTGTAGTMVLAIPPTEFPTVATGKSASLVIGIANQTTIPTQAIPVVTAPAVTDTILVTNSAPVISDVTDTASYSQPAPGVTPPVAPYELVSIFGSNFFSGATTMLNPATAVVQATPDPTYSNFPTTLAMTGSGKTAVNLSVAFKTAKTSTAAAASYPAPILFASNTQINVLVPSALSTPGTNVSVVVSSGSLSSTAAAVTTVEAIPGILTLASTGVGPGAIVNIPLAGPVGSYSINGNGHAAATGDTIEVYVGGMGAPDSNAPDSSANTATSYPATCVAISNPTTGAQPGYLQLVNTKVTASQGVTAWTPPNWSSIDGAVIMSRFLTNGTTAPCFTAAYTVTGTLTQGAVSYTFPAAYAGFVQGAVAGLYQVNLVIPTAALSGFTPGTGTADLTIKMTDPNNNVFTTQSGVTVQLTIN